MKESPETSNLYEYTPYTPSINLGKVGGNTFLNRIKNSKSTFYPY